MQQSHERPRANLSRRSFLSVSAGAFGGMMIALHAGRPAQAEDAAPPQAPQFPPEAFITIQPDGEIVIAVNRVELGQGVTTSLPMILADEMDADWSRVRAELAPGEDVYKDPVFGIQVVAGSTSIANSFQQYRELGANARALLVAAAAARWGVAADKCRTEASTVRGPGGRSATYAELAEEAASQQLPEAVALKQPSEFRLIGKPTRRLDSRAKGDGSFKFAIDFDVPGMKVAMLARPPVFGGRVASFDAGAARAVPGVEDVFEIPLASGTAVAVIADGFWTAKTARDALVVDWDTSGVDHVDSEALTARYRELIRTPGKPWQGMGEAEGLDGVPAARRLEAEFEFPYLSHAQMEPLCITIRYDGDQAEVWSAGQSPTMERATIAGMLGLKPEQVRHNVLPGGGAFGRRGTMDLHLEKEAAALAERLPGVPVKLMWSREDDMRGGYYRPAFAHRAEIGIGADGFPKVWRHVVAGQSFLLGSGNFGEPYLVKDGVDFLAVEGIADAPYGLGHFHVSAHHPEVNVPTLSLRSIGHTHSSFVRETLIEELADRAGIDPIDYRMKLVRDDVPKSRAVLELLKEKSGPWLAALEPGHAVGTALSEYQRGACACLADVSFDDGALRVHRVLITVHCGLVVNPMSVESQFQGGFVFGLSQILPQSAITLEDGIVQQSNFFDYTPAYMPDAPLEMEVHLVDTTEPPTGFGECPVPLAAPSVANALSRLTGKRYRKLPIADL
ncbi:MAG: molybdopterin cofactor-binding domain-containing protein [Oricola sp.]